MIWPAAVVRIRPFETLDRDPIADDTEHADQVKRQASRPGFLSPERLSPLMERVPGFQFACHAEGFRSLFPAPLEQEDLAEVVVVRSHLGGDAHRLLKMADGSR
jgi:hypothetical protein